MIVSAEFDAFYSQSLPC